MLTGKERSAGKHKDASKRKTFEKELNKGERNSPLILMQSSKLTTYIILILVLFCSSTIAVDGINNTLRAIGTIMAGITIVAIIPIMKYKKEKVPENGKERSEIQENNT